MNGSPKRSEFPSRPGRVIIGGAACTIPNRDKVRAALPRCADLRWIPRPPPQATTPKAIFTSIFLSLLLCQHIRSSPAPNSPSPSPTGSSPPEYFFLTRNPYHTTLNCLDGFSNRKTCSFPHLARTAQAIQTSPTPTTRPLPLLLLAEAPHPRIYLTLVPDDSYPSDRGISYHPNLPKETPLGPALH